MSTEILSPVAFDWFLSAVTGLVAAAWLVYDSINLWRLRSADRSDPKVGDKRFGYVIGLVIALVGITGVAYHHLA